MDGNAQLEFLRILEGMRDRVPPGDAPARALSVALERGLNLGLDDIREWSRWMDEAGLFICPTLVAEFIERLTEGLRARVVADPWAGIGSLLLPLTRSLRPERALGIESNPIAFRVAGQLDTDASAEWTMGDSLSALDNWPVDVDLVVSCLPMLKRPIPVSYDLEGAEVTVVDDLPYQILLKSSLRLGQDGLGLFVVAPGFLTNRAGTGVRAHLGRFGLSLDAVFAIPAGGFAPITSMPTAIVAIRRGTSHDLFVGEVAQRPEPNAVLIENYRARQAGRVLPLGRLVEPSTFRGYAQLAMSERVQRLGRETGLQRERLGDMVVRAAGPDRKGLFQDAENAVYVCTIGLSRTATAADERVAVNANWIQLSLDGQKADARYVAGYLNSELGRCARQAQMRGAVLHRLPPAAVHDVVVYLPPIDIQLRVLETESRISNIEADLTQMKARLRSRPLDVEFVANDLAAFDREEALVDWLESLPSPLASILWTYHAAASDPRKQLDYLDHFFEALAEFQAVVLLSAFRRDSVRFDEYRQKLMKNLAESHLSFERPTFGTWLTLHGYFAKKGRSMLGSPEGRSDLEWLFCEASGAVLEMLFSSRLVSVLQTANKLRNDFRGHGPPAGDRAVLQRLSLLVEQLALFREVVAHRWDDFQLVLPGSMTFSSGSFVCSAQSVVGTRTPFASTSLELAEPLDSKRLYFVAPGSRTAMPMLPFVKVLSSPEAALNACYFFNRREADGFKFVSYHFEDRDSVVDAFPDMEEALGALLNDSLDADSA